MSLADLHDATSDAVKALFDINTDWTFSAHLRPLADDDRGLLANFTVEDVEFFTKVPIEPTYLTLTAFH